MAAVARRVTITEGEDGKWRMRVQSTNWRVIFSSKVGAEKRSTCEQIAKRKWPEAEVVVEARK